VRFAGCKERWNCVVLVVRRGGYMLCCFKERCTRVLLVEGQVDMCFVGCENRETCDLLVVGACEMLLCWLLGDLGGCFFGCNDKWKEVVLVKRV
jgi:hypothetical protein